MDTSHKYTLINQAPQNSQPSSKDGRESLLTPLPPTLLSPKSNTHTHKSQTKHSTPPPLLPNITQGVHFDWVFFFFWGGGGGGWSCVALLPSCGIKAFCRGKEAKNASKVHWLLTGNGRRAHQQTKMSATVYWSSSNSPDCGSVGDQKLFSDLKKKEEAENHF